MSSTRPFCLFTWFIESSEFVILAEEQNKQVDREFDLELKRNTSSSDSREGERGGRDGGGQPTVGGAPVSNSLT